MSYPSVCLVVLDGWGLAEPGPGNAISLADTPVFDELWEKNPHTTLTTHGPAVGLPEGQMGNSEVGHLNLGAGAVVKQDLLRIDEAIEDGSFFENEALKAACTRERLQRRRISSRSPGSTSVYTITAGRPRARATASARSSIDSTRGCRTSSNARSGNCASSARTRRAAVSPVESERMWSSTGTWSFTRRSLAARDSLDARAGHADQVGRGELELEPAPPGADVDRVERQRGLVEHGRKRPPLAERVQALLGAAGHKAIYNDRRSRSHARQP